MSSLLKSIGDNLVIRDGVIATRDGRPLGEYLASCGFKDGMDVSLVLRQTLIRLDAWASCAGIG